MSFDSPYGDAGRLGRSSVTSGTSGCRRRRRRRRTRCCGHRHPPWREHDARALDVLLVRVQGALHRDARVLEAGDVDDARDLVSAQRAGAARGRGSCRARTARPRGRTPRARSRGRRRRRGDARRLGARTTCARYPGSAGHKPRRHVIHPARCARRAASDCASQALPSASATTARASPALREVLGATQRLGVELVHVLGARRARREPRVLGLHLEAADRRAVARRVRELRRDRLAGELGRGDGVGRQLRAPPSARGSRGRPRAGMPRRRTPPRARIPLRRVLPVTARISRRAGTGGCRPCRSSRRSRRTAGTTRRPTPRRRTRPIRRAGRARTT
jgi:hypothetical protein